MTKKTDKKKVSTSPTKEEKINLIEFLSEKEKREEREKTAWYELMKQIIGGKEFVISNSKD